jgi:transposase
MHQQRLEKVAVVALDVDVDADVEEDADVVEDVVEDVDVVAVKTVKNGHQ